MKILECHKSRDGLLTFLITQDDDGDITIGFDGFGWHTHGDLLTALSNLSEADALAQLTANVLNDRKVIVLHFVRDKLDDVWLAEDPTEEIEDAKRYGKSDERFELRYWSGSPFISNL
jgi:hypothetical protein